MSGGLLNPEDLLNAMGKSCVFSSRAKGEGMKKDVAVKLLIYVAGNLKGLQVALSMYEGTKPDGEHVASELYMLIDEMMSRIKEVKNFLENQVTEVSAKRKLEDDDDE